DDLRDKYSRLTVAKCSSQADVDTVRSAAREVASALPVWVMGNMPYQSVPKSLERVWRIASASGDCAAILGGQKNLLAVPEFLDEIQKAAQSSKDKQEKSIVATQKWADAIKDRLDKLAKALQEASKGTTFAQKDLSYLVGIIGVFSLLVLVSIRF